MRFVIDTNALLLFPHLLDSDGDIVVPYIVLQELDKLKFGQGETAYLARQAIRKLKTLTNAIYDFEYNKSHPIYITSGGCADDLIIDCAKKYGAIFVSGDYAAQLKAKSQGIEVLETDQAIDDEYSGYLEKELDDNTLAQFYEDLSINTYSVLKNQYLILKNHDEIVDAYKWNGYKFIQVTNKTISTLHFGKFKALDTYQKCAIDSLFTNDVTLLRGKPGSGKSLISLNYAMSQIENGKFQKLVCLVNPVPVRNAQQIGFYKGDKDDKLLQSGIGNILISKFGDRPTVEAMISTGKIVLIPMVDIRGYDSGDNSILWVTEGQNASSDLLRLTLQRVANGSKIIIDGDDKTQVDADAFAGSNNGIRRMSKVFRGTDVYGEMTFSKIYRSKIAEIADLM